MSWHDVIVHVLVWNFNQHIVLIVFSLLNGPVDLWYSVASCLSQRPLLPGLGLYALLLQQVLKHIPYNGCIIN